MHPITQLLRSVFVPATLEAAVGRKAFMLLFSPVPLYTLCIALQFVTEPRTGPMGTMVFASLTLQTLWLYSLHATRREQENQHRPR